VVNKPKIQGTKFESWIRDTINSWGDRYKAFRLAEGGSADEGDVQVNIHREIWVEKQRIPHNEIIFECKARQNLNIHQTYAKAKEKAGNKPLVLAWKKLVRKGDNKKRTADGISTLYIVDEEFLRDLLDTYG